MYLKDAEQVLYEKVDKYLHKLEYNVKGENLKYLEEYHTIVKNILLDQYRTFVPEKSAQNDVFIDYNQNMDTRGYKMAEVNNQLAMLPYYAMNYSALRDYTHKELYVQKISQQYTTNYLVTSCSLEDNILREDKAAIECVNDANKGKVIFKAPIMQTDFYDYNALAYIKNQLEATKQSFNNGVLSRNAFYGLTPDITFNRALVPNSDKYAIMAHTIYTPVNNELHTLNDDSIEHYFKIVANHKTVAEFKEEGRRLAKK